MLQTDIFNLEAVDLGALFRVKIRHDNSMLSPAWFLDRVEIQVQIILILQGTGYSMQFT